MSYALKIDGSTRTRLGEPTQRYIEEAGAVSGGVVLDQNGALVAAQNDLLRPGFGAIGHGKTDMSLQSEEA